MFSKTTNVEFAERGPWQREHSCKERGPHSAVWNVFRNILICVTVVTFFRFSSFRSINNSPAVSSHDHLCDDIALRITGDYSYRYRNNSSAVSRAVTSCELPLQVPRVKGDYSYRLCNDSPAASRAVTSCVLLYHSV